MGVIQTHREHPIARFSVYSTIFRRYNKASESYASNGWHESGSHKKEEENKTAIGLSAYYPLHIGEPELSGNMVLFSASEILRYIGKLKNDTTMDQQGITPEHIHLGSQQIAQ